MNAKEIVNDDMSLDEKLAAIDAAAKAKAQEINKKKGRPLDAPVDPAELNMCVGCQ